jgi:deferrochelatase/peroxidase EfeB
MSQNQVTLEDMAAILQQYFRDCSITWESGNFYTLVASNNQLQLGRFVAGLSAPAIPKEFEYEDNLPRSLF